MGNALKSTNYMISCLYFYSILRSQEIGGAINDVISATNNETDNEEDCGGLVCLNCI